MQTVSISDTQVLVLAAGDSPNAISTARGKLFEVFIARLLERFGYVEPHTENLNATSDGIELDIEVRHRLSGRLALVECKSYTSPVAARELTAFYGKVTGDRLTRDEEIDGFLFALPRLAHPGVERARKIEKKDSGFRYLDADGVASIVGQLDLLADLPVHDEETIFSDPAIVVTEHGVYKAQKVLDHDTRTCAGVIVWARRGNVPSIVLQLLASSDYARGVDVEDAREQLHSVHKPLSIDESLIVEVRGSGSDFEYQLPASPRYFIGRGKVVDQLEQLIRTAPHVVVVNALSGWGKSSIALRMKQSTQQLHGHAVVFDTRTASHHGYVASALRIAALQAEREKLLHLPAEASWASLPSALDTLSRSEWVAGRGPLVVFFDQFENVFRDERLTREFRDLALGLHELSKPLLVGFAWKTDLVDWTEGHPYRLRDEIRLQAQVISLPPLGPREVDTLLRRLDRSLGTKLNSELRQRLREYSQGFPWLFKKLANHVRRELESGASQADLVSDALNIQSLFEADLAELQPEERESLLHIARYAPVSVSEIMDRFPAAIVQSLINQRKIVQVGERLDTYWDTFRDFLLTGKVPVEDSYILRMAPGSVGRMLQKVEVAGGNAAVIDLANEMHTSEKVIWNLSRDLKLFGALDYEPNRVRLVEEIASASDKDEALRRRVAVSLRRHRAYSTLVRLAELHGGSIVIGAFTRALPATFPAVAAKEATWSTYARSFAQWFDYAGLVAFKNQSITLADDRVVPKSRLFGSSDTQSKAAFFPGRSPGPAIRLLKEIAGSSHHEPTTDSEARSVAELFKLAAVVRTDNGVLSLADTELVNAEGVLNPDILLDLLIRNVPGAEAAIRELRANPQAPSHLIGAVLREAQEGNWSATTVMSIGKYFRAWAHACGVHTKYPSAARRSPQTEIAVQEVLPIEGISP